MLEVVLLPKIDFFGIIERYFLTFYLYRYARKQGVSFGGRASVQ